MPASLLAGYTAKVLMLYPETRGALLFAKIAMPVDSKVLTGEELQARSFLQLKLYQGCLLICGSYNGRFCSGLLTNLW